MTSGMLKAYDVIILKVNAMNEEKPIDQMSDEDFVLHRAQVLVAKNKLDAPFVITPVQWIEKVNRVSTLEAEVLGLRERTHEAERRTEASEATRDEWCRLYEETRLRLDTMEASRDLYQTANTLAENAIHELAGKLSSAEARVAHLRRMVEARGLPPDLE